MRAETLDGIARETTDTQDRRLGGGGRGSRRDYLSRVRRRVLNPNAVIKDLPTCTCTGPKPPVLTLLLS